MPDDVEQSEFQRFSTEYLGRLQKKRDRQAAYQAAINEQALMAAGSNPENLPGLYASDPTKAPADLAGEAIVGSFGRETATAGGQFSQVLANMSDSVLNEQGEGVARAIAQKRSDFTVAYEEAYYRHRGEIPFDWLMQWTPSDLRLIGGEAFAEEADKLESLQLWQSARLEWEAEREAELERRWEAQMRSTDFYDDLAVGFTWLISGHDRASAERTRRNISNTRQLQEEGGLKTRDEILREIELERGGKADELYEDEIKDMLKTMRGNMVELNFEGDVDLWLADYEDQVRMELRQGTASAYEILGLETERAKFVKGSLEAFGWAVDKGAWFVTEAMVRPFDWAITPLTAVSGIGGPYDGLKNQQIRKMQERKQLIRDEMALPDEEIVRKALGQDVHGFWDELATTNPDIYNEYIRMGGGEVAMGFAFFMDDMTNDPRAQEQLSTLVSDYRASTKQRLVTLKESNFRVSDSVMDALASYGEAMMYVPTAITLLATDSDIQQTLLEGDFAKWRTDIHNQIEANNRSPASALNMDGSLAGLMLDLGAGFAADPATWFTGARLGRLGKRAATYTQAEASALARGPVVRQLIDDAVDAALDPGKGGAVLFEQLDWLGGVGERAFLAETGWQPQVLPGRAVWRDSSLGLKGANVGTPWLGRLLPATDPGLDAAKVARLADSISTSNFDSAVIVGISRETGEIGILDGVHRVAAAVGSPDAIPQVPVVFRVMDEALPSGRPTMLLDDVLDPGTELYRALDDSDAGLGTVDMRPDQLVPREQLLGINISRERLQEIATEAIMNGHVPRGAERSAYARALTSMARKAAHTMKPAAWAKRYSTPQSLLRTIDLSGPSSIPRLRRHIVRMWGDDVTSANFWADTLMDHQFRLAQAEQRATQASAHARVLARGVSWFDDTYGSEYNNLARRTRMELKAATATGDSARIKAISAQLDALEGNYAQARAARDQLNTTWEDVYTRSRKAENMIPDATELGEMIKTMYDDYNLKHIATKKHWAGKVDPDTGLVPWEELMRGRSVYDKTVGENKTKLVPEPVTDQRAAFVPLKYRDLAEAENWRNPESLYAQLAGGPESTYGVTTPISMFDLMAATERGGAWYTKAVVNSQVLGPIREGLLAFHKTWVVDKVFRPATAVTVSMDELLRIWHVGGPRAAMRWAQDRALFLEARGQSLIHGGVPTFKQNPLRRTAVDRGGQFMSKSKQERLATLQNYPDAIKRAERGYDDWVGMGWEDIDLTHPEYEVHARAWFDELLGQSGFRAYLRGPEDFRQWYYGPDGRTAREAATAAINPNTGSLSTRAAVSFEDVIQGWDTFLEKIVLARAKETGRSADLLAQLRKTAASIDEVGGRVQALPSWVFQHTGEVRGILKVPPTRFGAARMTESFFETLFMNPVNFRRGFLADLVRSREYARLESLFSSQNRRIVSDLELERYAGLQGYPGMTSSPARHLVYEKVLKQGDVVPQGYVDDLVEQMVLDEIENVLFAWDSGSRLGRVASSVFPFGRPWADMAGFWGREMMRKPVLRGAVNDKNLLMLRTLNEKGLLINGKSVSLISRLANTDFTIDQGLGGDRFGHDGGIIPGSEATNFAPMIFLPTAGENPLQSLIPGLGVFPTLALDALLKSIDPVANPLEYQQMVDKISDFIPGMGYQQGGWISRLAGGGSLAQSAVTAVDIMSLWNTSQDKPGGSFFGFTTDLGDISREISRTRELSALLADPEELELLLGETDEGILSGMLASLSIRADHSATQTHLARTLTRWVVPASAKYDTALGEIMDVWVTASDMFPELSARPDLREGDLGDHETRRQFANDVRKSFFELEQWKRDSLVAQYPQLAVNLVSSWEWHTDAEQDATIPGTDQVYRTGSSAEDRALHQYYVESGLVRPLNPIERARRILGMMRAAKESAAKHAYTISAEFVNDSRWEGQVPPGIKGTLEEIAQGPFGERWDLRSAREVWNNWGSLEEEFEMWVADENNVAPGTAAFDNLKQVINIPTKYQPWGTTWPGRNPEELSGKYSDVVFNQFPEEVEYIAEALGVPLTPGMTGIQLYHGLQAEVVDIDSPLWGLVNTAYDSYIKERAAPGAAALDEMRNAMYNLDYDVEWRQSLKEFIWNADRTRERYFQEVGGVPLSEQQKVVDQFMKLRTLAGDMPMAWDTIWENRYASSYGDLDWTPPTPLSPHDEDGRVRSTAVAPFIEHLMDGDSFVVRDSPGGDPYMVRLLGVRARDYGLDDQGALEDKRRLDAALRSALDNNETIWLVRDPETFGSSTDYYGRMLAWLWIGDEPYYFEEDFRRQQTPSGGS